MVDGIFYGCDRERSEQGAGVGFGDSCSGEHSARFDEQDCRKVARCYCCGMVERAVSGNPDCLKTEVFCEPDGGFDGGFVAGYRCRNFGLWHADFGPWKAHQRVKRADARVWPQDAVLHGPGSVKHDASIRNSRRGLFNVAVRDSQPCEVSRWNAFSSPDQFEGVVTLSEHSGDRTTQPAGANNDERE